MSIHANKYPAEILGDHSKNQRLSSGKLAMRSGNIENLIHAIIHNRSNLLKV